MDVLSLAFSAISLELSGTLTNCLYNDKPPKLDVVVTHTLLPVQYLSISSLWVSFPLFLRVIDAHLMPKLGGTKPCF